MKWHMFGIGSVCAGLAVAGVMSAGAQQERERGNEPEARQNSQVQRLKQTLTIPPQEGLLRVRAVSPQEVRVGSSYEYEIHVSNMSQDMMLHDVKIKQQQAEGFQIEESTIVSDPTQKSGQRQRQNAEAQQVSAQQEKEQQQQSSEQQSQEKKGQQGKKGEWTISQLGPGETRVIKVTAASDQEGSGNLCLAVTSFTPSLCLQTKFVQPELEVVKRAPEKASVCQPIEFHYLVKNGGTGDLQKFTIVDQLPEGLKTIEGEDQLKFAVDGLKAGDTRKFVARLRATKPGEFASRAVAKLPDGEEVRSGRTTTVVEQADLAVAIEGPSRTYVNRPVHYTVRVTNTGNIAAQNAQLALRFPDSVRLVDAGEPRESRNAVSGQSSNEQRQPIMAEGAEKAQQQQAEQQQERNQQQKSRQQTWDLGKLEPNQTMQVAFTVRPSEGGTFEPQAIAQYVCGDDQENVLRSVASAQTQILSLPALAIAVVDNEDPVPLKDEVVYTIVVQNEGTAPDSNVQVKVELPEGLKYVESSGETEAKADGQSITFQPIEKFEAGEKVSWKVRTRAAEDGNVQFRATLTSEHLEEGAIAEEPTRLIQATAGRTEPETRRE